MALAEAFPEKLGFDRGLDKNSAVLLLPSCDTLSASTQPKNNLETVQARDSQEEGRGGTGFGRDEDRIVEWCLVQSWGLSDPHTSGALCTYEHLVNLLACDPGPPWTYAGL